MGWFKRLFGVKDKVLSDAEIRGRAAFYNKRMEESKYRTRSLFDYKFGSPFNTGPFHTKMPNK